MAKSLLDLLDEMNASKSPWTRHYNRGVMYESRYDGHSCHPVIDLHPDEIDAEDDPERLHADLPRDE